MSQTVSELLKARNLPGLCDREKMKTLLLENEYGYLPDTKWECSCTEAVLIDGRMCGGVVKLSKFDMTISSEYGSHTFPVFRLFHRDGKKHPFFILLNFHQVPSLYFPVEESATRTSPRMTAIFQTDLPAFCSLPEQDIRQPAAER